MDISPLAIVPFSPRSVHQEIITLAFRDRLIYNVIGENPVNRPCQLLYTKNGKTTIEAWARYQTPDKCWKVAEKIMGNLTAAGATCFYVPNH